VELEEGADVLEELSCVAIWLRLGVERRRRRRRRER
jgi:hypothetical protein